MIGSNLVLQLFAVVMTTPLMEVYSQVFTEPDLQPVKV